MSYTKGHFLPSDLDDVVEAVSDEVEDSDTSDTADAALDVSALSIAFRLSPEKNIAATFSILPIVLSVVVARLRVLTALVGLRKYKNIVTIHVQPKSGISLF